jgi:hypothetical protein
MSKIPHRKSILRVVAPADSVGHASKSGQGEPESPLRNRSQHKRLFTNLLVRRQRRCRVRDGRSRGQGSAVSPPRQRCGPDPFQMTGPLVRVGERVVLLERCYGSDGRG